MPVTSRKLGVPIQREVVAVSGVEGHELRRVPAVTPGTPPAWHTWTGSRTSGGPGPRTARDGRGRPGSTCTWRRVWRTSDVDRWVQSACVLCSNGCGCDIAVKDGRMVGVRGRAADVVNHGRLGPKGLYGSTPWASSHATG